MIRCNSNRILQRIEDFGKIGQNEQGGVDRPSFSAADVEARQKLIQLLQARNLQVTVDPIGNIFAKRKGKYNKPSILLGSHIDSVPNGGKYDGMLGVLVALEIMEMLDEHQIETNHPIELVSFTAEEPNPYGLSTLGSRTLTGKLRYEHLIDVVGRNQDALKDAVLRVGGDLEAMKEGYSVAPGAFTCFIELHIEQGMRMVKSGVPIAIVTDIVGIYRDHIKIIGELNHAGTTMMEDRKDALVAAAELITFIEQTCRKNGIVGTVGQIDIFPNAVNIIPGQTELVVELRAGSKEKIYQTRDEIHRKLSEIKERRGVDAVITNMLDQDPVPMDPDIIDHMQNVCEQNKMPYMMLSSFAGHDASHLASVTKAGMLFVPSKDGKSHCPEEYTDIRDIAAATDMIFETVLRIDQSLERS